MHVQVAKSVMQTATTGPAVVHLAKRYAHERSAADSNQWKRRIEMDQKYAIYVFIGLAIGALFGFGIGSANGSTLLGVGFGALAGAGVGWFIAAAATEKAKQDKQAGK